MFDYWASDKMEFSAEDKRACFETAKTIVALCEKVRQGGILALEADIHSTDNAFLKMALQLIVDGVHHDEIKKMLENLIISGNYRGKELFNRILIMDGMLALQRGYNPAFVREAILASRFGEDLIPEYNKYLENNEIKINVEEKFWEKVRNGQNPDNKGEFETIGRFDDFAIQILLRETAVRDLVAAFEGASENVVRRVLDNMSKRNADMTMNSCLAARNIRKEDITEAQKRIWDKVREMEESGQIVISK